MLWSVMLAWSTNSVFNYSYAQSARIWKSCLEPFSFAHNLLVLICGEIQLMLLLLLLLLLFVDQLVAGQRWHKSESVAMAQLIAFTCVQHLCGGNANVKVFNPLTVGRARSPDARRRIVPSFGAGEWWVRMWRPSSASVCRMPPVSQTQRTLDC